MRLDDDGLREIDERLVEEERQRLGALHGDFDDIPLLDFGIEPRKLVEASEGLVTDLKR